MAARDLAVAEPRSREFRGALDRLVNGLLFITLLASPLVFIEPSPYEAFVGLLALVAVAAGLIIDRKILPLLVLLLLWNVSGLFSLIPVVEDSDAVKFMAISFYMAFSAILFACLFTENTAQRLAIVRAAYVLAAILAALAGIAGYFHLVPGSDLLTLSGRARGTFKDPNVYGPFLILPLLFLIERIVSDRATPRRVACAGIIFVGIFLSFSRGAWMHLALSIVFMSVLLFVASDSGRVRLRILGYTIAGVFAVAALLTVLLSLDAVSDLFTERARVVQDYDSPDSGRFGKQIRSLPLLLEHPNGFGPLQFRNHLGQDPHNVYLNAFSSYGWVGGIAYVLLVLTTLFIGFRNVFMRSPWQPYFIPALAAFAGVVVEGMVVDTDHWRHFYLLLGIVWGLSVATMNAQWRQAALPGPRPPDTPVNSTASNGAPNGRTYFRL